MSKREFRFGQRLNLHTELARLRLLELQVQTVKRQRRPLLYHMLSIGGKKPLIAGNIGTVSCAVAEKATEDNVIVLEASSFQLMGVETFRPNIAILTNLYDSHLDYHGTSEAYAEAKAEITSNQKEDDFLIYNADQEEIREIASKSVQ